MIQTKVEVESADINSSPPFVLAHSGSTDHWNEKAQHWFLNKHHFLDLFGG